VMLATHRRGEIDRLFAGSVADRVIRNTNCPVFLVPENKEQQSSRRGDPSGFSPDTTGRSGRRDHV